MCHILNSNEYTNCTEEVSTHFIPTICHVQMRLNLEVGESKTRSTRKSLMLKNVNGHDVPVIKGHKSFFKLSSWHLFWRSPISTPFLFISRNAMHMLRWRHYMFFCLQITWLYTIMKKNWKVRDSKVRNNRFCRCIAVWSNFLRLKITHHIKVKFSWWNCTVLHSTRGMYFVWNNACVC